MFCIVVLPHLCFVGFRPVRASHHSPGQAVLRAALGYGHRYCQPPQRGKRTLRLVCLAPTGRQDVLGHRYPGRRVCVYEHRRLPWAIIPCPCRAILGFFKEMQENISAPLAVLGIEGDFTAVSFGYNDTL